MFLSPLSSGFGTDEVRVPAPANFRPLRGIPRSVEMTAQGYSRLRGNTAARENGLRYESQVQMHFMELFPDTYVPSPRFDFIDGGTPRYVLPDGLFVLAGHSVVVEIKLAHMPEAWWQLHELYRPVVQALRPRPVYLLEVCQSFDPATPFPEKVELIDDLRVAVESPKAGVMVLRWKK